MVGGAWCGAFMGGLSRVKVTCAQSQKKRAHPSVRTRIAATDQRGGVQGWTFENWTKGCLPKNAIIPQDVSSTGWPAASHQHIILRFIFMFFISRQASPYIFLCGRNGCWTSKRHNHHHHYYCRYYYYYHYYYYYYLTGAFPRNLWDSLLFLVPGDFVIFSPSSFFSFFLKLIPLVHICSSR